MPTQESPAGKQKKTARLPANTKAPAKATTKKAAEVIPPVKKKAAPKKKVVKTITVTPPSVIEYVLDTNVLLHDPEAIFKFDEHNVVIPVTVIEEIDHFKKDMGEKGRNARQISRHLDELRHSGKILEGMPTPGGGTLRVVLYEEARRKALPNGFSEDIPDNRILAAADTVRNTTINQTKMVTKDTNLRIKANIIGIEAEDYRNDRVNIDDLYTGLQTVYLSCGMIDQFHKARKLAVPQLQLRPHEFVTLVDNSNPSHVSIGRYDHAIGAIVPLSPEIKNGVWGLSPKNREQQFALDLLLNDNIKLVTLVGKAGTGKTLMAIAAGLQRVMEDNRYSKLLVSRPVFPMGKDLGFLPGDIKEKLGPWMQPIYDGVEFLLGGYKKDHGGHEKNKGKQSPYEELEAMGVIKIEPLTYIRGRSIPKQFMIVDEAQNLTPQELKTIITRAGTDTKIILTGDPYQIDSPFMDASTNGLTYTVEKFKDQAIAGHITLTKGERSELAEIASNIM